MSVAIDIMVIMFESRSVNRSAAVATAPRASSTRAVRAEVLDQLAAVQELQSRIREMQATTLETRDLPTLPALAEILPGGALKQGAAYSVDGSMSLAMGLLAGPSADGAWCGVVGVPEFGAEAASGLGIDLERLVLVPDAGADWITVTAALVDVLTVVLARPPATVAPADVARLGARLRQRGAALIVLGDWPQSEARLRLRESSWQGVGHGHGRLRGRQATIDVTGRAGMFARGVRMWLPGPQNDFARVAPSAPARLERVV